MQFDPADSVEQCLRMILLMSTHFEWKAKVGARGYVQFPVGQTVFGWKTIVLRLFCPLLMAAVIDFAGSGTNGITPGDVRLYEVQILSIAGKPTSIACSGYRTIC